MSYVTPTQLAQYLPAAVLSLATLSQQQQACDDASQEADSYLRGRYALPLQEWGADVTRYTAYIASYLLCTLIGFAPQTESDRLIVERYYMAVGWPDRAGTGWFPGVQRQAIHPDVVPAVAQPGDPVHDLPQVSTSGQRGWQTTAGNGRPSVG